MHARPSLEEGPALRGSDRSERGKEPEGNGFVRTSYKSRATLALRRDTNRRQASQFPTNPGRKLQRSAVSFFPLKPSVARHREPPSTQPFPRESGDEHFNSWATTSIHQALTASLYLHSTCTALPFRRSRAETQVPHSRFSAPSRV